MAHSVIFNEIIAELQVAKEAKEALERVSDDYIAVRADLLVAPGKTRRAAEKYGFAEPI